jgi:YARHG domain-containing protein
LFDPGQSHVILVQVSMTGMQSILYISACRLLARLAAGLVGLAIVAGPCAARGASPQLDTIFDNGNIEAVQNQPTQPTVFVLSDPTRLVTIRTYHWNNGRGATPGTIAVRNSAGQTYGPWQTAGQPGQGGVPNAYWVANPNVDLAPGQYVVVDSDPSSWAQNGTSGGVGFASAEGYTTAAGVPPEANATPAPPEPGPATSSPATTPPASEGPAAASPGAETPPIAQGDVCLQLWVERNSIYKAKGYCFKTQRAISYFGNGGCMYANEQDVPLTRDDRARIARIQQDEITRGCR